jgi:hypothetical protein
MSSAIHGATCVARDRFAVDIELAPTTACGPHFPLSRFFGLFLLHEAATTIVSYEGRVLWRGRKPEGLIADELSFDELMDLTGVDTPDEQLVQPRPPALRRAMRERKQSLVDRFVARVSYVAVKGWRPMLCAADAGHYRDGVARGGERFRAADAALDDAFDRAPEDDPPTATLRIEATDIKWMCHLEPGMSWAVYAFDDDAALLL